MKEQVIFGGDLSGLIKNRGWNIPADNIFLNRFLVKSEFQTITKDEVIQLAKLIKSYNLNIYYSYICHSISRTCKNLQQNDITYSYQK